MINGKGRYSGGPTDNNLTVVNVTAGKRSATLISMHMAPLAQTDTLRSISYRFRLVSISCDPNYTFSIDGHDLTIIEVDGNNVDPLVVDSIQIFAGETLTPFYLPALIPTLFERPTLFICRKIITLRATEECGSRYFPAQCQPDSRQLL